MDFEPDTWGSEGYDEEDGCGDFVTTYTTAVAQMPVSLETAR